MFIARIYVYCVCVYIYIIIKLYKNTASGQSSLPASPDVKMAVLTVFQ